MKKVKVKRKKKKEEDEKQVTTSNVYNADFGNIKKLMCIIKNKDHSCDILYVKGDDFFHNGNYYHVIPDAIYVTKKGVRVVTFFEGVTLPVSHNDLEYELKDYEYHDPISGKVKRGKIKTVKGIRFDSKLFSEIVDGKLIDVITKSNTDVKSVVTVILLVVAVVASVASAVISYLGMG